MQNEFGKQFNFIKKDYLLICQQLFQFKDCCFPKTTFGISQFKKDEFQKLL